MTTTRQAEPAGEVAPLHTVVAEGADDLPRAHNERVLDGLVGRTVMLGCVLFTAMHLYALNIAPIETWTFRILHVAGGLLVGFAITAAMSVDPDAVTKRSAPAVWRRAGDGHADPGSEPVRGGLCPGAVGTQRCPWRPPFILLYRCIWPSR